MTRQETVDWIAKNPEISVLIVGAGINGIGTFRDLALQGVDVLIVDKGDFCSGASAASSHMVHGGIRYLENGEFRLVREAVQERNRLIDNAPHYVKPLATTIPIFKWTSGIINAPLKFIGLLDKPAERGALVIKAGLTLYDAYTKGQGTVPRHDFMMRKQSLAKYPALNDNILCTATYYDAAMPSPERICMDLLHDAETAHDHAKALNYVRVGTAAGGTVSLHDELSGETIQVQPKLVINAAGPWIDFANQAIGQPSTFIGGTKGSHLVINRPDLRRMIGDNEFFFENEDGRIVLIYPLYDKVMIGTSDLYIDNPDDARCTDEEIDYFFKLVTRVFPSVQLSRDDIVFQFSGVRPLPASDANSAGQVSRDHSIRVIEPTNDITFPIYCLIGGKWTTFRAFAEKATDKILAKLGQPRRLHTRDLAIGGGKEYPHQANAQQQWLAALNEATGIPTTRLQQLFDRYGTRAAAVAHFIREGEERPLQHHPTISVREVAYITAVERVAHLDDFILRRSLLGMLGQITAPLLAELSHIIGDTLHWSETHRQQEVARATTILVERHGVQLA